MGFKNDGHLDKIGEDEPIFTLRAQDLLAPETVRAWIAAAKEAGVDEDKILEANQLIEKMYAWRETHPAKMPD